MAKEMMRDRTPIARGAASLSLVESLNAAVSALMRRRAGDQESPVAQRGRQGFLFSARS